MVAYSLTRSTKPHVDPQSGAKSLQYYVETKKIFMSSKIYTALCILALFDPLLLSFLPWYSSSFSDVSLFPTLSNMKMCLFVKLLQLLLTFVSQIMVAVYDEHQRTDSNFKALLYLNLALSGLTFLVKMAEACMKRGLLAGSGLSEESEAADEAAREQPVLKEGEIASSQGGAENETSTMFVELADIYPITEDAISTNDGLLMEENPMHTTEDNEVAASSETDPLLDLQSRLSNLERLVSRHLDSV